MKLKDFIKNVAFVTVIVLFIVYAGLNQLVQAQTQTLTDTKTNTESSLASQTTWTMQYQVYSANWYAQTFQYSEKFNLTQVSLYLSREGSPSGDFIVSIRQTSDDKPTGSDLVNASITASSISTSPTWYNFSMNIILNATTRYAIVVRCPNATDSSNCILWWLRCMNVYDYGAFVYSTNSGSSWTIDNSNDFAFNVYGFTITPATLTFSATITTVNYVKVNGIDWTDYTYSGNTITVNGLTNLGTYNIEAQVPAQIFSPFFVPTFTILLCLSAIFITADALYLWKTIRREGIQT
jgi:hypothetical protein